jgi:UDP-N-acetylglucosamine 2-epimerase (non-hydrolysing)
VTDRPEPVRSLAVLTTGRQDWGILRSSCTALRARPSFRLDVVAGGMHLSASQGQTVDQIRADGFEPARLPWLDDDAATPADVQAARALEAFGGHLRATTPGAVLLVGDRFETAAAALAATVNRVPIAHLHGGEQSLGAFDDALRHATTKLAHLHLVSHEEHARRVIAMGEDPGSVHVVGAPGLDAAFRPDLLDRDALAAELGVALRPPVVIVTVHPVTLGADPAADVEAVAATMRAVPATYVVTMPNVDPGAERIRADLIDTVAAAPSGTAVAVPALGERRYWSLLRVADAMLGNSSSGLIEAPVVGLPAVNVGERQAGRLRWANVIDAPAEADAVIAALRRALDPAFRATARDGAPPLADGRAGERVADIIAAWRPSRPPRKPPIRIAP